MDDVKLLGIAPLKPLPLALWASFASRGGVGVGSVRIGQTLRWRTDPTPGPSPEGEGGK